MDIDRMLRRPEVERITGFSRASIYSMMSLGRFPRPVKIGERAVAWPESDIRAWVDAKRGKPARQEAAR